jgi:hypothetical protein
MERIWSPCSNACTFFFFIIGLIACFSLLPALPFIWNPFMESIGRNDVRMTLFVGRTTAGVQLPDSEEAHDTDEHRHKLRSCSQLRFNLRSTAIAFNSNKSIQCIITIIPFTRYIPALAHAQRCRETHALMQAGPAHPLRVRCYPCTHLLRHGSLAPELVRSRE